MTFRVGLQPGLRAGLRRGVAGTATPVDVPVDGPLGVFLPASAADWTELGLPAPILQYNCQDASGGLAPTIGALTLAESGAGQLYERTVAGWSAKAVGVAQDNTGGWSSGSAATRYALNESYAWLAYAAIDNTSGSTREFLRFNNSVERVRAGAAWLQCTWNSVDVLGTKNHEHTSLAVVHAILHGRNATTSTAVVFTDLETVAGTYSGQAAGGANNVAVGGPGGTGCAARVFRLAFWKGSDAETILAKTTLTTLGWQLPY